MLLKRPRAENQTNMDALLADEQEVMSMNIMNKIMRNLYIVCLYVCMTNFKCKMVIDAVACQCCSVVCRLCKTGSRLVAMHKCEGKQIIEL